jgi:carboxymethylenebutenolidase
MGEMVQFPFAGGNTGGYLATPKQGSGPGVIVIQEWWGLVDHIKDVAIDSLMRVSSRSHQISITGSRPLSGRSRQADDGECASTRLKEISALRPVSFNARLNDERQDRRRWLLHGRRALALHGDKERSCRRVCCVLWWTSESEPICRTFTRLCWVFMVRKTKGVNPDVFSKLERDVKALGKSIEVVIYPGAITPSSTISARKFITPKLRPMRGGAQSRSFASIYRCNPC